MRKNPRGAHEIARPIAAAFRLTCIEQDKILAWLGMWMIAVSGMEIGDVVGWIFERNKTRAPGNVRQMGVALPDQFELCRTEKWHGKKARQMNSLRIEADVYGKAFHEKLPVIPVVKRARAEEKNHRCVNRRLRKIIPGDPQSRAPEFDGFLFRDREFQRAQHRRRFVQI